MRPWSRDRFSRACCCSSAPCMTYPGTTQPRKPRIGGLWPSSRDGGRPQEARLRLADTTPSTLEVSASPAPLWPPNHKLVPITVAVQVSDDHDPNSIVQLVSITCDDACDPALDVVGAEFGTNDRQFQLRSERKGTSSGGRTYTITYSADDDAGNKTRVATTVTVTHDQGKKK